MSNAFVVMKFGGTSVADEAAIGRLVEIVRRRRERDGAGPAVVVSAMSGVTDTLLDLAHAAGAGDAARAVAAVDELRARHHRVARMIDDAARRAELEAALNRQFDELAAIARALSVLHDVSPRSLDVVAATGELASSRLITAILADAGLPAVWVDARRAIVTSADFTGAQPLMDETRAALGREVRPQVEAGRIPVMGGFIGATTEGVTTTLGRGGSDYSAAIVGAGTGAREIQIWTDVDGMLTADPRVVANPRVVPHLSFAEASELAYFGAKVLHPATILPAVDRNIPVRILNSRRPDGDGTVITAAAPDRDRSLAALACKRHVTVVDITSSRMLMAYGFLRRLFEVFERYRTAVDVVTTSEVSVSVTVDDTRNLDAVVAALSEFADVQVEGDMALLCAVGDSLRAAPNLGTDVLKVLDGFPLRMVSQAASRRNITVVLNQADLAGAMAKLHDHFFARAAASA